MSLTCNKTTLLLLRILSRHCDTSHEFGLRSYCSKVFTSSSPHQLKIKPKVPKLRDLDDEPTGHAIKREWHIDSETSKPSSRPLWDKSVKAKNDILRKNIKSQKEQNSEKLSDADVSEQLYREICEESGIYDEWSDDAADNTPKRVKSIEHGRRHTIQTNTIHAVRKPVERQRAKPRFDNKQQNNDERTSGETKQEERRGAKYPARGSTFVSKEAEGEPKFDETIGEVDAETQTALAQFVCCVDQEGSEPSLKAGDGIGGFRIPDLPVGKLNFDLSSDEFNKMAFLEGFKLDVPGPLDECKEDLSDLGPGLSPTFNFAAYADKSELIQEYVKLGVSLYRVEKDQDHMRALLTVDLKKELPVYIQFLHDCGVPADCLGKVITKNPMVLKEDMDDLKTRIRYLRAHNFSRSSIARIVTENPTWLTWATKHIDERLGHFQNEFTLRAPEVRFLATRQPRLITYDFKHIHELTFAMREEMGFDKRFTKFILLSKPRLWMNSRRKVVSTFDYAHNVMKLSHLMIAQQVDVLTCRKRRLQSRHEFLKNLKLDQYDPKKPNYIAPKTIVYGSDAEFCRDIAKTAVDTYNLFLRTQ